MPHWSLISSTGATTPAFRLSLQTQAFPTADSFTEPRLDGMGMAVGVRGWGVQGLGGVST